MSTSDISNTDSAIRSTDPVDDAKDELSQVSREGAEAAREVAESRYEQGREAATDQLDSASEAMNEVAAKLADSDSPFASYAAELSDQLSSFSSKLSTSSIDDLAGGARSLARDNPAAFMLGSMAIGLAASRFFKAAGEQISHQSGSAMSSQETRYDHYQRGQREGYNPGAARDPVTGQDSAHPGVSVPGNVNMASAPTGGTSIGQSGSQGINEPDTVAEHNEHNEHNKQNAREEA